MARQLRRSGAGTVASPPARRTLARPVLRPELTERGRGFTHFLSEVRSELRKVVWPTRREGAKLTALVVAVSVAIGIALGIIDFVFAEFFRLLVNR